MILILDRERYTPLKTMPRHSTEARSSRLISVISARDVKGAASGKSWPQSATGHAEPLSQPGKYELKNPWRGGSFSRILLKSK
jgi:hypothetical protein